MANCLACESELTEDMGNPDTDYQFDNALWIGFFGGYGMFTDAIDVMLGNKEVLIKGAAHEAVICHDCAHALCEQVPWIGKLIEPELSHAHTKEFWEANPDHDGWDHPENLKKLKELQ